MTEEVIMDLEARLVRWGHIIQVVEGGGEGRAIRKNSFQ